MQTCYNLINIQFFTLMIFLVLGGTLSLFDKNYNKTNLHVVSDYIFDIYLRVLVGVYALWGEGMNIG